MDFAIHHDRPFKKMFSQLDLPATTKRLIILADSNLNYPSILGEYCMQVTEREI